MALEVFERDQHDLCVYAWETDSLSRLTFDPATDSNPVWSPDGRGFVFHSNRDGHGVYWRYSDESGEPVRLTEVKYGSLPFPGSPVASIWLSTRTIPRRPFVTSSSSRNHPTMRS